MPSPRTNPASQCSADASAHLEPAADADGAGNAPELVLHVLGSERDSISTGLQVARNAHHGFAKPCTIALVIQGPAVRFLAANAGLDDDIAITLALPGVTVVACGNSLRSAEVPAHDLITGVSVVPAAVVFLAQSQFSGSAYVRV